jgi:hypothetical protein
MRIIQVVGTGNTTFRGVEGTSIKWVKKSIDVLPGGDNHITVTVDDGASVVTLYPGDTYCHGRRFTKLEFSAFGANQINYFEIGLDIEKIIHEHTTFPNKLAPCFHIESMTFVSNNTWNYTNTGVIGGHAVKLLGFGDHNAAFLPNEGNGMIYLNFKAKKSNTVDVNIVMGPSMDTTAKALTAYGLGQYIPLSPGEAITLPIDPYTNYAWSVVDASGTVGTVTAFMVQ